MIAAGIDIGTNTFRLLIADTGQAKLRPLAKKLITVRLGQGLAATGLIEQAAMERGLEALAHFRTLLDRFAPQSIKACGTEALRKASNRDIFLNQAATILGQPIEIITGNEEATLNLVGACAAMGFVAKMLLVDVGGGSTELVAAGEGQDEIVFSLPLGAVTLSENYPENSPTSLSDMTAAIEEVLLPALTKIPPELHLVGSGGTATSLAALDLKMTIYNGERIQGHCLSTTRLTELCDYLAVMSVEKRSLLPQLGEGRGDIILAGAMIYQVLLAHSKAAQLTISDAGLLEGILQSAADKHNRANH